MKRVPKLFSVKSRARWPGSFLDSPMRNVLSGLCFYDHATDAQEPYCLARTGEEGEREGGRQTEREADREGERSLFLCLSLSVV